MLLFFDIETAPAVSYDDLSQSLKVLRSERYCKKKDENHTDEEHYYLTAWLYAEYSKILCISSGFEHLDEIKIMNFKNKNEKKNIEEFFSMINNPKTSLAWYNIKWFDMAFVCKRAIINWIEMSEIPTNINHLWKKPRDIDSVDVMEMWKFGGSMWASLWLACEAVWIESPKGEVQGNMIWTYYYSDEYDLVKVMKYCENDVRATIKLHKKIKSF